MKNYSIHSKLNILFVSIFVLMCAFFVLLLYIEINTKDSEERFRQENLIKNLLNNYTSELENNIKTQLNTSGFITINNARLIQDIRSKGQVIFMANNANCILSSVSFQKNLYFDVSCEDLNGTFKHDLDYGFNKLLLTSFIVFSSFLVFMYFSILKSLKPLNTLKFQISATYNGKSVDFSHYKNDEIGKIANEFKKSFNKNQELIHSRQLFLRMIMHELKTPIGKGRIVTELITENRQKNRLVKIFKRLDSLINEFAKIEYLFSKNYNLDFKKHSFTSILKEAKTFLMQDNFEKIVSVKIMKDALLNVDMEMFSLCLKNLIDNALKYASDNSCELECYGKYFLIKNKGEPLKEDFSYYLGAFARDKNSKVKGTGLGLYIINEICKMHNFDLLYAYENKKHCFKVIFDKI
ncbi:sensor histidine kinase [Campylobacter sp. LR291e]|uniref:ArsS family sensor histidine kinase n=1 Tax=Campylobacter sp. LR291e TaxID=2593546 RepID=UPI001239D649|nr:ArsS family sensor histidine kinase [Campylobacter sp. LR291e]KAA6234259.1 sensor histidine kinase [Campylobacter sp. LR291e]